MISIIYLLGFVITFACVLTISVKYLPEYGWKNFIYSTVTALIFPVFWIYFLLPKKRV